MNRTLSWSVVVLLAFSACHGISAGIPCDTRAQCEPGQDCITAPGGFCSRGCSEPGQVRDCPQGTICSTFGNQLMVCSTPCQTDADCRINFECKPTHAGAPTAACRPLP